MNKEEYQVRPGLLTGQGRGHWVGVFRLVAHGANIGGQEQKTNFSWEKSASLQKQGATAPAAALVRPPTLRHFAYTIITHSNKQCFGRAGIPKRQNGVRFGFWCPFPYIPASYKNTNP